MKNITRPREIYPGIDNRYVICDVCGKKFRVKDTIRIVDRFNLLNNMIVCLADADETNPQIKPIYIQEDLLVRKDYVKPEPPNFTYTNYENGYRLPTAPRYLTAKLDQFSGGVLLEWVGPSDYGDVLILGYKIYRSDSVVYQNFEVINQNTGSGATSYIDYTANIDDDYIYIVSIVTNRGESPLSNLAYYPKEFDLDYLCDTQREFYILADQSDKRIAIYQTPINPIVLSQNNAFLVTTQYNDMITL